MPVIIAVSLIAAAVFRAEEPRGQAALALALDRLPVTAAVLHIAAHPDDEDTALLAWLARGRGVRAAYLSATRGEGGQNLLGGEQYEALGLLRTQELLAARRLDGARQFFSRAYDFGYSRDAEEALAKWGRERTLSDFVRVIRRFRPDVIVSRFAGGPQDGHGQHAAAGILAREAFRAAGDPARFPEHFAEEGLRPWQAKKFYVEINRFGPAAGRPLPEGALEIDLGDYSPVLGRSFVELAMQSRSLHRSQAMGAPQRKGPFRQAFLLEAIVDAAAGGEAGAPPATFAEQRRRERDLLDGIDGRLPSGPLTRAIDQARAAFAAGDTARLVAALAEGLRLARDLPEPAPADTAADFESALALAHGLAIDALADRREFTSGDQAGVTVTIWNRAPAPLAVDSIELQAAACVERGRAGAPASRTTRCPWQVEAEAWQPAALEYNRSAARAFRVTVPDGAAVSQPYWLQLPREGDSYQAPDPALIGLPENPPVLEALVRLRSAGTELSLLVPVAHRGIDSIYGQIDSALEVMPSLAAWLEPPLVVFPPGAGRALSVRLRAASRQVGAVNVQAPPGWTSSRESLEAPQAGQEDTATLRVDRPGATPSGGGGQPRPPGRVSLAGRAGASVLGYEVIDYPHIRRQLLFRPAETTLVPLDVRVEGTPRVGYIMGAGDAVPGMLRQLGVSVELLAPNDVASGDLSRFTAIVTGIRAYAVRPELATANGRLLDWVRRGGTLIVQYNSDWPGRRDQGDFPFGPYPMRQDRRAPRVSQEEQPVEILAPEHPLMNAPNKITAADFQGWVQERGLYFMSEWAPGYTPLLSSHDRGEPPRRGGLLAASYGKGTYIYTAYAWFRQLPAGVPGAFRIWANLLSTTRTE